MRLTVWDPFRDMALLQRPSAQRRACYPPVQMVEKDDEVIVTAEIPGTAKEEVDLTVLGDTLTIAGEKKLPAEGVNYIRHERPHGKFRRLIDLPYAVDHGRISATYRDGVLKIVLPKAEEAKLKQIKVE